MYAHACAWAYMNMVVNVQTLTPHPREKRGNSSNIGALQIVINSLCFNTTLGFARICIFDHFEVQYCMYFVTGCIRTNMVIIVRKWVQVSWFARYTFFVRILILLNLDTNVINQTKMQSTNEKLTLQSR